MKTHPFLLSVPICCLAAVSLQAQTNVGNTNSPSTITYAVATRDANSRQWVKIITTTNADGSLTMATNTTYKEMASGLCYQENGAGPWLDSVEQVKIVADGAEATQSQHKVHWMGNINTAGGSVHLVSPTGKDFVSRVYGLSYWDTALNTNILLAPLQDSQGQLVGSNRVVYPNAFQNLQADVEYVQRKSGIEQNVILREPPPSPESLGLNPQTTRLEVLTEFFSPPAASVTKSTNGGIEDDAEIDFGDVAIGVGTAFKTGQGHLTPRNKLGFVSKHWGRIEGRDFLIEEVPYRVISNAVQELRPQSSVTNTSSETIRRTASLYPLKPRAVADGTKQAPIRLAEALGDRPGVVLDYTTLGSRINGSYTFQSDTTYYLTSELYLAGGPITFEPGTVIKGPGNIIHQARNQARVALNGTAYRPIIFTSANDDSVGDTISGSTGRPSMGDCDEFLDESSNSGTNSIVTVNHVRFSYSWLAYEDDADHSHLFKDCQFLQCAEAIADSWDSDIYLENVLFSCSTYGWDGGPYPPNYAVEGATYTNLNVHAENVTADSVAFLNNDEYGITGGATNCIFTACDGSESNLTLVSTIDLPTNSGIFQQVGAGYYYLANASTNRGAGTTNIDPSLLQELSTLTTYPPMVFSNATISVATNFGIQATRDAGNPGPDLGYHYDPLDWVFGGVTANSNITFSAGTGVGWFRTTSGWYHAGYGIYMANSTIASFQGTATAPVWWVRANTVQEQGSGAPWQGGYGPGGLEGEDNQYNQDITVSPQALLNFTHTSILANGENGSGDPFRDDYGYLILCATNSEFHGGQLCFGYVCSCLFTNCLMDRTAAAQVQGYPGNQYQVQNCTFHGGAVYLDPNYTIIPITVKDSTFDGSYVENHNYGSNTSYTVYNYNAFTSSSPVFSTGGTNNLIETNGYNWQTSWLGNYYLPTNSPLIAAGDASATNYGLYHFTTQTNQTVEGTNIVTLGYHYVACGTNGLPLDTENDGVPDYLMDANGDGIYDAGDLGNWLLYNSPAVTSTNGLIVFTVLQ